MVQKLRARVVALAVCLTVILLIIGGYFSGSKFGINYIPAFTPTEAGSDNQGSSNNNQGGGNNQGSGNDNQGGGNTNSNSAWNNNNNSKANNPSKENDPCLEAGELPCGQGDHGRGNPINGSLHANCRAAQGEVDPTCDVPTETASVCEGENCFSIEAPLTEIPNPNQVLEAAFAEISRKFRATMESSIAFNKPENMKLGDTTTVELLLNPSLPESELATELLNRRDFVTSTAEPRQLVDPVTGSGVSIETSNIVISDRMRARLISIDKAFDIQEITEAEQVIRPEDTTTWRWSVTAKEEGTKTLELVIDMLVQYEGKDYWSEVQTYDAYIVVNVSPIDKIKSWDWKWIVGIIVTALLIPAFWRWVDSRKKSLVDNKKRPVSRKPNK